MKKPSPLGNSTEQSDNLKSGSHIANQVIAFVVMAFALGLIGFAWVDESVRPIFLDVAKVTIAAYLGYWLGK